MGVVTGNPAGSRRVGSATGSTNEATTVLKAQVVEAIVARLERGEAVKRLAVEYGVDPKTIRAWRDRGAYRLPLRYRRYSRTG